MSAEERLARPLPERWPGTPPHNSSERSEAPGPAPLDINRVLDAAPELLERAYFRTDYHMTIIRFGAVMAKQLEQDPDAKKAFKRILERHGVSFEETGEDERAVFVTAGAAICIGDAAAGAVIGWFAADDDDEKEKK